MSLKQFLRLLNHRKKTQISNDPLLQGGRLEFTELRDQGVWGEATHTREMCVAARLLKSGNEGYSKENRQNIEINTFQIIYRKINAFWIFESGLFSSLLKKTY